MSRVGCSEVDYNNALFAAITRKSPTAFSKEHFLNLSQPSFLEFLDKRWSGLHTRCPLYVATFERGSKSQTVNTAQYGMGLT